MRSIEFESGELIRDLNRRENFEVILLCETER